MTTPPTPPLVLVTGAGGDIGRACAVALAARSWSVAVADHPSAADSLEATRAACAAHRVTAWSTTFDVTEADQVRAAVAEIVESVGTPNGLVNNAGYQGAFAPIERYPLDDARRVIEVNVLGVFNMLAVAGAAMIAAGKGGAIVNTASMAGVSGAPNMPAYSASKAAVIGLTKSAAKDLAPAGIRVNAISPAFIGPGKMWDRQVELQAGVGSQYYSSDPTEVARQMIALVPMRRCGTPDEVANVVAYLLSDDASYLTGVNIEISGGSI
jgi:NAD(P)-dependent dehydrogenase (short-subunit alcohol dehydrogenase family)